MGNNLPAFSLAPKEPFEPELCTHRSDTQSAAALRPKPLSRVLLAPVELDLLIGQASAYTNEASDAGTMTPMTVHVASQEARRQLYNGALLLSTGYSQLRNVADSAQRLFGHGSYMSPSALIYAAG